MSKVVIAANAMIENKEKITDVIQGYNDSEIFFKYDGKYKWSIIKRGDDHYGLIYYPGRQTLEQLASIPDEHFHEFNEMVGFNSKTIGTRESLETFSELFSLINNMKYGMEDVLDDIINSSHF